MVHAASVHGVVRVNLQDFPVASWSTWSVASYAHSASRPTDEPD